MLYAPLTCKATHLRWRVDFLDCIVISIKHAKFSRVDLHARRRITHSPGPAVGRRIWISGQVVQAGWTIARIFIALAMDQGDCSRCDANLAVKPDRANRNRITGCRFVRRALQVRLIHTNRSPPSRNNRAKLCRRHHNGTAVQPVCTGFVLGPLTLCGYPSTEAIFSKGKAH